LACHHYLIGYRPYVTTVSDAEGRYRLTPLPIIAP
jgi:hypothetical protein